MGKDDSVLEKQALLSQQMATEAKKRAAEDELSNIKAKLVAIDAIIEKKRMFEVQKETLGRGPARGMDLVKKVAELNLQAEK